MWSFLLMSFTTLNLSQVFVITPWAEGNYSFPQATFFRKSVSPTAERGGGDYDLSYQNLVRKYEDDMEQ